MASKSLNKVLLIGNLTRDPEIRTTPSGSYICTFGLATNSRYKKPDGTYAELTNFHSIVAWSKLAEVCAKKLKKGMKVYVEGELRTRTWQDENGQMKRKTEVRISSMFVIDSKSGQKNVQHDDGSVVDEDGEDKYNDHHVQDVANELGI
ncbi:MAG: hypothetical protein KatS3mg083_485 [Candidatus Dojkabacteria bacterium]|nr:MAG: hypothetical protein KatS3mg083_485 [Candidatus Dojkabacteria bacterium]